MEEEPTEKINWWPIVTLFAIGAVLMAGAGLATSPRDIAGIDWLSVTEGALVNIGTAFLVAGLLFFMERRFVRRVRAVSRDVATTAIAESEQRVYSQVSGRLDDIERQLRQRVAEDAAHETDLVNAIKEQPNYDSLTAALTEANDYNAISNGTLTVPASDEPDGSSTLSFSWGAYRQNPRSTEVPVLELTAHISPPDLTTPAGTARTVWSEDSSSTDAAHALVKQARTENVWQGQGSFDFERGLENLHEALRIALASNRRDADALHLSGALIQLLDPEWFVTEAGLERPETGYLLPRTQFQLEQHRLGPPSVELVQMRPDDIAEPTWLRVIGVAHAHFGLAVTIARRSYTGPEWQPWTSTYHDR